MDIRIGGVYHFSIIENLNQLGINHFTFDLRPHSMNFTQIYKIKQMMENANSSLNHFYLHFENDKDFMIKGALEDIIKSRGQSSVSLEFSGTDSLGFYEQFEYPYVWHFNDNVLLKEISQTKYLKKISFNQLHLERLLQFGYLYDLLAQILEYTKNRAIEFEINTDWDSAIMETLLDFYPISTLSFEINKQVETSFRQVNLLLVQDCIEYTKKHLNF